MKLSEIALAAERGENVECYDINNDTWVQIGLGELPLLRIAPKPKEKVVLYQWLIAERSGACWTTTHQNEKCLAPPNAKRLDETRMEVEI